jgi:hypothetical protein
MATAGWLSLVRGTNPGRCDGGVGVGDGMSRCCVGDFDGADQQSRCGVTIVKVWMEGYILGVTVP